jgi:hypothetical protein
MSKRKPENQGDLHNFGRRVRFIDGNTILKPREAHWEKLILCRKSPFRRKLEAILAEDAIADCLPDLSFGKTNGQKGTPVEILKLNEPIPQEIDPLYLFEALGGLIAFTTWLGIEDLHFENIFVGTKPDTGQLIITPIDIEMIFFDRTLPFRNGVLPLKNELNSDSALFKFRFIEKMDERIAAALVYGYRSVLKKMISNNEALIELLLRGRSGDAHIRFLVHNTRAYQDHLRDPNSVLKDITMTEDEIIQLNRGEYPYFFFSVNDPDIRFFTEKSLKKTRYIQHQSKIVRMKSYRFVQPAKLLRSKKRNEWLMDAGTLILASYFVPSGFSGKAGYRNLRISANRRNLEISFDEDSVLQGPRKFTDEFTPIEEIFTCK